MANFIEYQLNGNSTIPVPVPPATFNQATGAISYTTTPAIYQTIAEDYNGGVSVHIISTTSTLVLEVCNRDPIPIGTGLQSPNSAPNIFGNYASFADTTTVGLWVTIQTMNMNTQVFAATMAAAGLYVSPTIAFRNIRLRQTATGQSQVILGFGFRI